MAKDQLKNRLLELEKKVCDLESKNLLLRKIIDKLPVGFQLLDKNDFSYLKESNERFELFTNLTFEGIAIHKNGIATDVNDSLCHMCGYTREELIGANLIEKLIYKEDIPIVLEMVQKEIADPYEIRGIKKDGTLFPVEILAKNFNYQNETLRVAAIRDITKRKEAEEAFAISLRNFRLLFEESPLGIYIAKTTGEIIDGNRALLEIIGSPSLEKTKEINVLKFPPLISNGYAASFSNCVKTGETQKIELEYTSAWGKKTYLSSFLVPLLNINGEVVHIYTLMEDITDRKNAEKELLESNLRFDLAINATSDGLWDWNMVTNEIYYSPNWKIMLGYEEDELPNEFSVWEHLIHPDDLEKSWDSLKEHTSGKKRRFDIEFRMQHKKGHWVHILSRANALFNEKGEPVRVVGTHVDISSQVENEKQLIELNATKDKFFSIIAHDLRGPLGAIMSFSELALQRIREGEFDKIEKYCDLIHKSTEQSYNLLNNLLQWSRLQTGRIDFNPEPLNLQMVVEKVKNLLEANYREKKITIHVDIDPSLQINADHFMLDAIIRNILSNSIKYNNRNGIVTIHATGREDEVVVTIEDNGIGIKSENLDKLFKIESSFSTKGTNEETGTGLGLVLCKEFVELHGGNIWVESEPNVGTKFSFTIKQGR